MHRTKKNKAARSQAKRLCNDGARPRVVVTGATGFIGRALCKELHHHYEVIALSRDASRAAASLGNWASVAEWDGRTSGTWVRQVDGGFAVVNLAGENVASSRWSESKKATILHSRLDSLRAIWEAARHANKKPAVVIQASAIGYYGAGANGQLDEASPAGKGFLADVCRKTERYADQIAALNIRSVVIRNGVVLGNQGGALPGLMRPFKFFLGAHPGSGKQWFSWISLDDEVAAIRFLMEHQDLEGVFNLTSPEPVTMKVFYRILGQVLKRPALLSVPGFILRLAVGQMADEMLLAGQKVVPKRLLEAGFEFKHRDVRSALTSILSGH